VLIKEYKSIRIFFFLKKNTTNQAKRKEKEKEITETRFKREIQWYYQH
jgi:hypothetical protein